MKKHAVLTLKLSSIVPKLIGKVRNFLGENSLSEGFLRIVVNSRRSC